MIFLYLMPIQSAVMNWSYLSAMGWFIHLLEPLYNQTWTLMLGHHTTMRAADVQNSGDLPLSQMQPPMWLYSCWGTQAYVLSNYLHKRAFSKHFRPMGTPHPHLLPVQEIWDWNMGSKLEALLPPTRTDERGGPAWSFGLGRKLKGASNSGCCSVRGAGGSLITKVDFSLE